MPRHVQVDVDVEVELQAAIDFYFSKSTGCCEGSPFAKTFCKYPVFVESCFVYCSIKKFLATVDEAGVRKKYGVFAMVSLPGFYRRKINGKVGFMTVDSTGEKARRAIKKAFEMTRKRI